MEPAPLTQAHAHAHAAFAHQQSHVGDLSTVSEEHALAAGEFAQAAKGTGDAEALRTLKLLEEHHQRLHEILRFRSSHPEPPRGSSDGLARVEEGDEERGKKITSASSAKSDDSSSTKNNKDTTSSQPTPSPAERNAPPSSTNRSLSGRTTAPARDLTSSIASNLASARGIPSSQRRRGAPVSPTLSAQHAGGKMSSTSARHRDGRGYRGSVPPSSSNSEKGSSHAHPPTETTETHTTPTPTDAASNPTPDEPFNRFYSTFETLLSRLSAPLAFAGLPLSPDDPPPATQPPPRPDRATATNEPDLTRLFSRAALRAVRENPNAPLHGAGGESFYVVPSTGGTISYAGILSRAEQERRHAAGGGAGGGGSGGGGGGGSNLSTEGDEEFVDAREVPGPPSPDLRRSRGGSSGTSGGGGGGVGTKTMEELQLENQALKQLSDTLSKRLHMWEVNAQSSSLALQQSLRVMQQHGGHGSSLSTAGVSPEVSDTGASGGGGGDREKRELEERLAAATREIAKLKEVIGRYRLKWEKLKEGARARREGGKTEEARGSGGGDE